MCAETSTALLTGTFALAGVALAQLSSALLSFLDKRHKNKVLLREKYEELSSNFLDSFELPQKLMGYKENNEEFLSLIHQKNANKAHMLAVLYFPELQRSAEQYILSYSELYVVSHSLYDPQSKLMLGEQVYNKPKYIEARSAHLAAKEDFLRKIHANAAKYTGE